MDLEYRAVDITATHVSTVGGVPEISVSTVGGVPEISVSTVGWGSGD